MDQKNGNKGHQKGENTISPLLFILSLYLINCSGLGEMAFLFHRDRSRGLALKVY